MIHTKQHITDLAEILYQKGLTNIVISPGSRNTPIIDAFVKRFGEACISIVDERSAGYFALGMALKTKKPAALICTSGTASLNYAPAVAEAFYQGVPMLVLTADRPPEWIDQQDNQTIHQNNLYNENVKGSFTLPVEPTSEMELRHAHWQVHEAYDMAVSGFQGPVQINIPLREPLYVDLPVASENLDVSNPYPETEIIRTFTEFSKTWDKATSILIVCGQYIKDEHLQTALTALADDPRVVVVAEAISNLSDKANVAHPDLCLAILEDDQEKFEPELVVYFGGQVVSKRLKKFLRTLKNTGFYYIDPDGREIDTFKGLTEVIQSTPSHVFEKLNVSDADSDFKRRWVRLSRNAVKRARNYLEGIPYSDLKVFQLLYLSIPEQAIVFAGNSSVVRYLQLFPTGSKTIFSNRGTSGIDGCVSTAAGIAQACSEDVYAIVGDLSFLYDSNALWNKHLPGNLKIIVINNEGGGIFDLIDGPGKKPHILPYLIADHPVKINKLAEAYGIAYFSCDSEDTFGKAFLQLSESNTSAVLEVRTPKEKNTSVFKDFYKQLKEEYGNYARVENTERV